MKASGRTALLAGALIGAALAGAALGGVTGRTLLPLCPLPAVSN